MNRKNFIAVCGTGVLATLIASCGKVYYAENTTTSKNIIVNLSEFEFIEKDVVVKRPFILVQSEQLQYPVAVYRAGDNKFTALYMQCSHSGCELKPANTILHCPCHGSEFSTAGKVLNPPADKDLVQFSTMVKGSQLIIELSNEKI